MLLSELRSSVDATAIEAHRLLGQYLSEDISSKLQNEGKAEPKSLEAGAEATRIVADFHKTYEDARLRTIDKLYERLNAEVGVAL
jgi:hypothetical protein